MKDDSTAKKNTPVGDDKILNDAKARFDLAAEAETEIRRLALEDLQFRAGEHWPAKIRAEREQEGRPCLVINRIPQFIQQVTNDQRQNRPSIKVHPVDDKGDPETAKVIQGLIRHIEYNSNADVAYDTAFDFAATGGLGYFRFLTDYVDPLGFEQEILIKRIRNPFSVYFDPHSQEPDGSDANFAFVVEDLSHDEFRVRYPNSKLSQRDFWEGLGDSMPKWVERDTFRVAEYFYKEYETKEIVLLSDGSVVLSEDLPRELPEGFEIVDRRRTRVPVIRWCKHTAVEILEKRTWPGKYIPIIPVYGTELYIDGKRILEGIVRHAKDSQRMYDYWASAETEAIALAPRSPFIAAEGQIEPYEAQWGEANRRNYSVLKYKPTALNGEPVPPPQRQVFEPAVAAITNARLNAAEDLKATTGIYDAALGARSNETSGKAILARSNQAQISTFHFIDNLTRSLRHAGRILIGLIPKVYDTARAARIIGEDGEERIVRLNEPFEENGEEVLYRTDVGKYDATVDVGPSYATKRQEAAASMLEMTRAVPNLMQVAGDLMVKNMDWPGAQELAERLKKTLPPELQDEGAQKDIPPQLQAQLAQQGQMIEELTKQLNQKTEELEREIFKIESNERIKMKELEVKAEIELAKIDAVDSREILQAEIAQINERLSFLRIDEPVDPNTQIPSQGAGAMGAGDPSGEPPTGGVSPG